MNRILEIRERVAKYGLSRIAKDEVAWWNARDELNFNAYDDLQYLLQDHTRLTAEIESLTAERDRFKARAEAAEADMKRIADDMDGETDACYPCALCVKNNSKCDVGDTCFEWRGPQEGAADVECSAKPEASKENAPDFYGIIMDNVVDHIQQCYTKETVTLSDGTRAVIRRWKPFPDMTKEGENG